MRKLSQSFAIAARILGMLPRLPDMLLSLGAINARGQQELFVQHLLKSQRHADPRALANFEHQVYSQNGEDGIITEIFRRIGTKKNNFIEIGVGDGLENNTAFLLSQGWTGLWMDGSPRGAEKIRRHFTKSVSTGKLKFIESFITAENVAALVDSAGLGPEVDLLSLDVDRNTYYVWEALPHVKARVVVVEYNATMPPWLDWKVRYRADRWWDSTFYCGASLKAYELLGRKLGYSLVGCDLHGVNAFFVRSDLAEAGFLPPFTAEANYEPPRYWLGRTAGHPRGYGEFYD